MDPFLAENLDRPYRIRGVVAPQEAGDGACLRRAAGALDRRFFLIERTFVLRHQPVGSRARGEFVSGRARSRKGGGHRAAPHRSRPTGRPSLRRPGRSLPPPEPLRPRRMAAWVSIERARLPRKRMADAICISWMRLVRSWGTRMQISTSAANFPPPAPVIPMVRTPMLAAVRTAASTSGLDPLVVKADQHVPGLGEAAQLGGRKPPRSRNRCRSPSTPTYRRSARWRPADRVLSGSGREFGRQMLAVSRRAAVAAEETLLPARNAAVITAAAEITPASPFSALKHDDISSKSA